MEDEDPRIDELDHEIARLRARVAELEAIKQRAQEMVDDYENGPAGRVARYILGETQ
jgi:outer membrane protein assembly factor BamD (BamD/ComL family)